MKRCPRCNQIYTDSELNFCLNDGELLTNYTGDAPRTSFDDSPPTLILDKSRVTNPTGWQASQPIQPWQGSPVNMPQSQFTPYTMPQSPNQILAIVSLCLGIGAMTVGWCCSMGLLLSPAALITGFIALSQIKKDSNAYGGRGLAIGGIVTGTVYLCIYLLIMIIYGLALIGGGIS